MEGRAKVSYFFISLEKFVAYSLTQFWAILFFLFSDLWEKKKHLFFFFSSEKFVSHSLATKADDPKNRPEKVKKRYLEVFFIFSRKILKTVCFFFSWKSLHFTHSLIFKGRKKKKTAREKKKNTIFTHSLDFCPKVDKNKLFQGNKKIRYLWPGSAKIFL